MGVAEGVCAPSSEGAVDVVIGFPNGVIVFTVINTTFAFVEDWRVIVVNSLRGGLAQKV